MLQISLYMNDPLQLLILRLEKIYIVQYLYYAYNNGCNLRYSIFLPDLD